MANKFETNDKTLFPISVRISQELLSEILAQRILLDAENNELQTKVGLLQSSEIVRSSVEQIQNHQVAEGKTVEISLKSENFSILTDYLLLNRVLVNLLKNALEATTAGSKVVICCFLENNHARFTVHNNEVMSEMVKHKIFRRSFSTKGAGRGTGTYSIKLLGEKYLKGRVWYTSTEGEGTTFNLELPLNLDKNN
jgi:signal transduction histidine kinase